MASRSHDPSTVSASRSSDFSTASRCSTTGTSPRCRSRQASSSARASTPSTGMPIGASASRSIDSCAGLPTRFSTTPATRTDSSNVVYPCTSAATEPLIADASTTRRTGASRSRATCAVLAGLPASSAPSNMPMTPSTTSTSAPLAAFAARGAIRSSPQIHASRFRPGRPVARAWYPGSMKSGPTFAGATRSPRRRNAAIRPVATVVLPTPECVPATTRRGPSAPISTRCPSCP